MQKFNEIEYRRPDIEAAIRDANRMTEEFYKADGTKQIQLIRTFDALGRELDSMSTLVYIRNTINTKDVFYKGEKEFLDENIPRIQEAGSAFRKAMLESKFRPQLEEEFGKQIFSLHEMSNKVFDPSIVEDLIEENKTGKEYSDLIAAAQIEFNGQNYTLSRLQPLMQDPDRETRKSANEAYYNYFAEHMSEFDDIFDRLVKIRDRIAKKLGYEDFVEVGYLQMNRSDYGAAEVAGYRDAIVKHVVPYVSKLIERQKKRIGLTKLNYYDEDFEFRTGNPMPQGKPEWLQAQAQKMYSEMSPKTKEFFDFMTEYDLFDLISRDGKMSGGYCTFLPTLKAPFIFANMNGTSGDVDVLTHEAGHALQSYLSKDQPLAEYLFPTYEACEIHSMSMEFFAHPQIDLFFGEDTDKYKFSHLAGTLEFLPYGALIDEFQHYVYKNPNMSPEERRRNFRELEKKYLPHRDYEDNKFLESGGFFFRQNHVFLRPFYYIDYTLAQVCALTYYKRMLENYDEAFENYLELCALGGSKSFLGLIDAVGLLNPFEEETLIQAVETVDKVLSTIDDSKF